MRSTARLAYPLLLGLFLLFIFPHFFHKLGQSSLTSFDEAWYAAIAKNINFQKPFDLVFNGDRFYDHPPAGFWLIRLSQIGFGENEFGSRAASAILGLACLVVVFLLASHISHPAVGIASAIALASSPWFISRARSANLDITLTFFFLLTLYLSLKASKHPKYLYPLSASLVFLILTKTFVPLTIIPALIILFWNAQTLKTKHFFLSLSLTVLVLIAWAYAQLSAYPTFWSKYFAIGYPKIEKDTSFWQNILLTKTYLHESIGTWFRPTILSLPLLVLINKIPNPKYLFSLVVFVITFLLPFAFSSRGQIWHLIPVIPILIIISFSLIYIPLKYLAAKINLRPSVILIVSVFILSQTQITKNWHEFINIPAYVSDEAILSTAASAYTEPLHIDDRFLPTAVYYSGKVVKDRPTPNLTDYFNKSDSILLITYDWRLKNSNPEPHRYQIIASDRDKILLLIFPASSFPTSLD